jgi:hypothetical protein
METITYFIIVAISYLGLLAGYIIINFAKGERKSGEKYFAVLNHSIYYLILFCFIYFEKSFFSIFLTMLSICIFILMNKYRYYITYFSFSILMYVLYKRLDAFLVCSVLIFLYGLVAGAEISKPS